MAFGEAAAVACGGLARVEDSGDTLARVLRKSVVDIGVSAGEVAALLINSPDGERMEIEENALVLPGILLAYYRAVEGPSLLEAFRGYVDRLREATGQLPDDSGCKRQALEVCWQAGAWYLGVVGTDDWLTTFGEWLRHYRPDLPRRGLSFNEEEMGYPDFLFGVKWLLPASNHWPGDSMVFQDAVSVSVAEVSQEKEFYTLVYGNAGGGETTAEEADAGADDQFQVD